MYERTETYDKTRRARVWHWLHAGNTPAYIVLALFAAAFAVGLLL